MIDGIAAVVAENLMGMVQKPSPTGEAARNFTIQALHAAAYVASISPDAATLSRSKVTGHATKGDKSKKDDRKKNDELDGADKEVRKHVNVVA